jgi:hypothetical protein
MGIRRHDIERTLRRAVLLALATPAGTGCSGELTGQQGAASCAVSSTTPTAVTNGGCEEDFGLNGSPQSCNADDAGQLPASRCATLCPQGANDASAMTCYVYAASTYSPATVSCGYYVCGTGRRPQGHATAVEARGPNAAARWLATMAHLEAAAVHAFTHLARELEAHGAPRALVRGARRAARDEVRHARVVRALAEREGGLVPVARAASRRVRSLEEMATENAVEGCVRETFGAAVAQMQAARAGDARMHRAMKRIAEDETRHAELSWAVARWLEAHLDATGRRRVHEARRNAVEALVREATQEPDGGLALRLGLPGASQVGAALRELTDSLWSSADVAA